MKLIDADAIIAALESFSDRAHGNQDYLNGIETAKELIAEADEAVVRCGDCDQYDFEWCNAFCFAVDERHYCSYGERRNDEI